MEVPEHFGHFFSHFHYESYEVKLYDSFIITFWLEIHNFCSKVARKKFYLPKIIQGKVFFCINLLEIIINY